MHWSISVVLVSVGVWLAYKATLYEREIDKKIAALELLHTVLQNYNKRQKDSLSKK